MSLKKGPDPETPLDEESKIDSDQSGESINDLATKVRDFLTENRNDGNKNYEILAISTSFMGVPLPLSLTASSILSNGGDVYVTVRTTVDKKKYVAPISSTPLNSQIQASGSIPASLLSAPASNDRLLKFKTITKYSYFESGDKWIKVLLPDLAGLKDHPVDKVRVEFTSNRSFTVEVENWNG